MFTSGIAFGKQVDAQSRTGYLETIKVRVTKKLKVPVCMPHSPVVERSIPLVNHGFCRKS